MRINKFCLAAAAASLSYHALAQDLTAQDGATPIVVIDEAGPAKVMGWACLKVDTSRFPNGQPLLSKQALLLRLEVDGQFSGYTSTGLYRKDVALNSNGSVAPHCTNNPRAKLSELNFFTGYKFSHIVDLTPGLHTFSVYQLDRTNNTPGYKGNLIASKTINTYSTQIGVVDLKSATATSTGSHVTINGWTCDTRAAYSPQIKVYDEDGNLIVTATANAARPDLKVTACKGSNGGQYPYGFAINFDFVVDRNPAHTNNDKFMDGMKRQYYVYGVDSSGVETKLTHSSAYATAPMTFGNTASLVQPSKLRRAGHLIGPPFDLTIKDSTKDSSSPFEKALVDMFTSTALNNSGDLILLDDPSTSIPFDDGSGIGKKQVSPDDANYPAVLANYHGKFLNLTSKYDLKAAAILQSIVSSPVPNMSIRRIRTDWQTRLSNYLTTLKSVAGTNLQNMEYFYLLDEMFYKTVAYDGNGNMINGSTPHTTLISQFKSIRTALRSVLPNAKIMGETAPFSFIDFDHEDDAVKINGNYVLKNTDLAGINEAIDLLIIGNYPVSNKFDEFLDLFCGKTSVSTFVQSDDGAAKANKCLIDAVRAKLPLMPVMVVTQGFLIDNSDSSFKDKKVFESAISIADNVRRIEQYGKNVLSQINQDKTGKLIGFGNYIYSITDPKHTAERDSLKIDDFLRSQASFPNLPVTQLPSNYFKNLSSCMLNSNLSGLQTDTGSFTCIP